MKAKEILQKLLEGKLIIAKSGDDIADAILEIEALEAKLESHTCENCTIGDYVYTSDERYIPGKGCLLQYYASGTLKWGNLSSCSEFELKK